MAPPALATAADIALLLGRPLTALETTNATTLLLRASAKVRGYTRQNLSQVLAETITLQGVWGGSLQLPQRPITAVSSVLINGSAVGIASYNIDRYNGLFLGSGSFSPDYGAFGAGLWGPAGSQFGPTTSGPSWGGPSTTVTVTYDHGYAAIPDDIVDVVAGLVAMQYAVPLGVMNETIGGYKVSYQMAISAGLTLSPEDKKTLNLYRRTATSSSIATKH